MVWVDLKDTFCAIVERIKDKTKKYITKYSKIENRDEYDEYNLILYRTVSLNGP